MKTQTPTKRTTHHLIASLALAAVATSATLPAWAWDSYYWTGATSSDFHLAENWNSNHLVTATVALPAWRVGMDIKFETADIVTYHMDITQNVYGRGGWTINAGTEAQPLEFCCSKGSIVVSPDSTDKYHYASGLTIASTCDSWAWINGGQWDAFGSDATIGSSDYAGHLLIGNDRGVDTLFRLYDGKDFIVNQGSVAVSNATVNVGGQLTVGNIAGKAARFDFYESTMVVSNYFTVKNSATFDLCGGSITSFIDYLTVDDSGEMTIRGGGRYACQNMLLVGSYSVGTLNITGGGEAASGTSLTLGWRSGSSGTVNITDGGVLTVPYIHLKNNDASATVALDGGTIRAAKDERLIRAADNLAVTVGANGGTIDANGYAVTIEEDLDDAAGAAGAMTFMGGGTVTLSGAIKYTGGTTIEAGTVVVVPDVAKRTALGAIAVTGLENNICEVVRLSGEGTFSAGDLPANTATVTFSVSPDGKSILAANGMDGSFWIGGSGDLAVEANWSDGVIPTVCPTIKWASPITLTNSGAFAPDTLTIPEDSAVVTLAGPLTVATLTNAVKLAVASTGSLTVTGELVAMPEEGSKTKVFLYSNEGTVTVEGAARAYCRVAGSAAFQYETVSENTQPIKAKGLAYDCSGSGQLWIRLSAKNDQPGKWVVGSDGVSFPHNRNANYSSFYVEGGGTATLHSAADWTLANTGKENSIHGDIWINKDGTVTLDTSDYSDNSVARTITLKGRIFADNVKTGSAVVIDGCGTVVVDTTGSHSSLGEDLQHTCLSNSVMQVNSGATLKINSGKKITGDGKVSLAAGATLALDADSKAFTPCIDPSVTLPAEGAATLRIDGRRLRSGEHVIATVASGTTANVTLDLASTALDGRKGTLRVEDGNLVLNIESAGSMLIVK